MPYPFAEKPTLREFIERVRKYGIEVETLPGKMVGPHGEEQPRYFRKGKDRVYPVPSIKDEECLTPFVLSSLCRQLDIPPDEFGFTIGFLEDPLGYWSKPDGS